MHDVLAQVVAREAGKLNTQSLADKDLLPESSLKALEMLSRCAKSLRVDPEPQKPGEQPTAEEALAIVEGE